MTLVHRRSLVNAQEPSGEGRVKTSCASACCLPFASSYNPPFVPSRLVHDILRTAQPSAQAATASPTATLHCLVLRKGSHSCDSLTKQSFYTFLSLQKCLFPTNLIAPSFSSRVADLYSVHIARSRTWRNTTQDGDSQRHSTERHHQRAAFADPLAGYVSLTCLHRTDTNKLRWRRRARLLHAHYTAGAHAPNLCRD